MRGEGLGSDGATPFDGVNEHGFAGVFELSAGRNAPSEACESDAWASGDLAGDVERGAVGFKRWVEGEYEFAHADVSCVSSWLFDAFEEIVQGEITGGDAFERADATHEHVIEAAVRAGLLQGDEVFGLFDDHDHRAVAGGVGADGAEAGGVPRRGIGKVVADAAVTNRLLDVAYGPGEGEGIVGRGLENVKSEALGGAATDAGEAGEFVDESGDGVGVRLRPHAERRT